jgi:hypothetical protein
MKSVMTSDYVLPNGQPTKIYALDTKNGDGVYLMPWQGQIDKNSNLALSRDIVAKADASRATSRPHITKSLHFPMVDLDEKAKMEWLKGAQIGDRRITEAIAQYKLQMDETGATAEAAMAMSMSRGFDMPEIIDGPMVVWFKRGNVVTFSAIVGTDDFKQPVRKKN